jgi:hypothetical protein
LKSFFLIEYLLRQEFVESLSDVVCRTEILQPVTEDPGGITGQAAAPQSDWQENLLAPATVWTSALVRARSVSRETRSFLATFFFMGRLLR